MNEKLEHISKNQPTEEVIWILDQMFERLDEIKNQNEQAILEEFVTTTADLIESEAEDYYGMLKQINKAIDKFNQLCI
jgi:hypothetical protein